MTYLTQSFINDLNKPFSESLNEQILKLAPDFEEYDDNQVMRGIRVWKYLNNSGLLKYWNTYSKSTEDLLGGNCPFTGCFFDEPLLDPIRDFIKNPESSYTFQDLMDECLAKWLASAIATEEYVYSDLGISNELIERDLEFYEDGRLF